MRKACSLCLVPVLLCMLTAAFAQETVGTDEGRTLVVATRHVPPFAMYQEGTWDGIAIELWIRVATELGYDTEFFDLGLAEMLTAVEAGRVDAAAAALTITSERESRLDFSHPFHTSGLGIAVRRNPGTDWMMILKRIFSEPFLRALTPLLILLTIIGLLVWLAERRRNPQFQGGPINGIGSGLWWSAVTMTTVGYGDKAPQTPIGRFIAIVWMFASIVIISSITAAIATALTVGRLTQTITGVDDLYQSHVLTIAGSTSETFLDARLIRHRPAPHLSNALDALERENADALVYDIPILRHLIADHYADSLQVLPQVLQRQDYSIALPPGSPLREDINRELLKVIRSSEWQRLLERYLGRET